MDSEYLEKDQDGINLIDNSILHAIDVGANYWSLWTEADNLKMYFEKFPDAFNTLWQRMGYRLRPSWVWQRKRHGTSELIVAIANDGIAGVPGILHIYVESFDGSMKLSGSLDQGHPYARNITQASFILPTEMWGQRVRIKAELETRGEMFHPVQWACKQTLNKDGSFNVQLKEASNRDFRKGV
jgi:hypothetical protein